MGDEFKRFNRTLICISPVKDTLGGNALADDAVHAAQLFKDPGCESVLFSFQHETTNGKWGRPDFDRYECRSDESLPYPYMLKKPLTLQKAFS